MLLPSVTNSLSLSNSACSNQRWTLQCFPLLSKWERNLKTSSQPKTHELSSWSCPYRHPDSHYQLLWYLLSNKLGLPHRFINSTQPRLKIDQSHSFRLILNDWGLLSAIRSPGTYTTIPVSMLISPALGGALLPKLLFCQWLTLYSLLGYPQSLYCWTCLLHLTQSTTKSPSPHSQSGILGSVLHWYISYLSGRSFRV